MSESSGEKPNTRRNIYIQAFIGFWVIILVGFFLYAFNLHHTYGIGMEQPIPFSHRVHVTEKKLSCFVCHTGAMDTARAGVPPLETCMLCHHRIIVTYPWIKKLREHYFQGKPVIWKRVYALPDFDYFDHSIHIHRGIDCSRCHGNVPLMDRIVLNQKLTMGFCIQCHRDNKASHDCFTCHR